MSVAQNPAAVDAPATSRGLSAPLLVGGAFVLTTVLNIVFQIAAIVFRGEDPHAPQGPIASMESIGLVGAVGLIITLAVGIPLVRNPARVKINETLVERHNERPVLCRHVVPREP